MEKSAFVLVRDFDICISLCLYWNNTVNKITFIGVFVALTALPFSAFAAGVTSHFGPQELAGAPGLFSSAVVEASVFASTATGGTIDFALTNTSLLTEPEPGVFANAFITEFQFDLPGDYEPIFGDCSVIAPMGARFSQGAGNPVLATDIWRTLDWDFGPGTGGGMIARANEASLNNNNNAIFSNDALDLSGTPVENFAVGFLANSWEGAAFDTIIFRVRFEDSVPITDDDLNYYACDHLTLKFQGGDGSTWVGNYTVPEPGTLVLIGCGLAVMAGVVRRKMR
ncbi:MAG: PEP-CTERM sorting domain-containing protein [Planctomycetota bacterium]